MSDGTVGGTVSYITVGWTAHGGLNGSSSLSLVVVLEE